MSLIQDLLKSATGLLTTGGGAGDLSGEAQIPQNVGQPIQSGVFQGSAPKVRSNMPFGNTGTFVPNADYVNYGISNNQLQNTQNKDQQSQPKKPDNALNTIATNPNLFQRIFKMTPGEASERWKDKGGFEGLMSNPAFSLGLAMMQSGAKGEGISKSMFDNALKAGAVSDEYSKRIAARSELLAPITPEQREEVEAVFSEDNYYGPDLIDKARTGNQKAKFREATDLVFDEATKIAKKQTKGGKSIRLNRSHYRMALDRLVANGTLTKRDPQFFGIRGGTIMATGGIKPNAPKKAEGGPVKANKEYIVGEKGPEMFVPQLDGNIINNDDAKVVNMLLESNPQLKSISRARAVKILKNRFPDYF